MVKEYEKKPLDIYFSKYFINQANSVFSIKKKEANSVFIDYKK